MMTRKQGAFASLVLASVATMIAVVALNGVGPRRIDEWRMRALSTHDRMSMTQLRVTSWAGNEAASFALGSVLVTTRDNALVAEGMARLEDAADAGDPRAQLALGRLLLKGADGIAPDYAASRRWLLKAASALPAGQVEPPSAEAVMPGAYAAFHLASIYRNGYGVARDPSEGFRWLERAANAGVPQAQFQLANAYRDGVMVHADDAMALQWLQRAAQAELPEANLALAIAYRNGELGLPSDDAEYWAYAKETAHGYKHFAPQ